MSRHRAGSVQKNTAPRILLTKHSVDQHTLSSPYFIQARSACHFGMNLSTMPFFNAAQYFEIGKNRMDNLFLFHNTFCEVILLRILSDLLIAPVPSPK